MPKATGTPINVTNGQVQREVCRFSIDVVYNEVAGALVPAFTFTSWGQDRLRDASGNIIWQDPTFIPISQFTDATLPSSARPWFLSICQYLDTQ
jgi:hypothetical protein